jgi:Zn-dependent protease with chaperone function
MRLLLLVKNGSKFNGQSPPEFMSTHPSDATRIANLKAMIPEAKATAAKFE